MLLFLPADFLVVLLMISSSFVRIVTALVPCVCVCFFFFFSVADHNGGAKPRVKRRGVVWESKREPLRCLLDQQVTG